MSEIQTELTPIDMETACSGDPIHTGPYSHIYLLPRFPHPYVVKRMQLKYSISKDERMLREEMIAKMLMNDKDRSPYLVEIKGGEVIGEFVYLGFRWEPATLAEYNKGREYGIKTKKRILWELATAMDYLKSQGIIHRDIKPSNILLSNPTLSLAQVRLADFGFARILDLSESSLEFTRGIGSPAYAAPEILGRSCQYDFAVDVWSFGAVAYELLAGSKPFPANSLQELIGKQRNGPNWELIREESAAAKEFLMHCLAVDQTQRFQIADIVRHPFLNPSV